MIKKSISTQVFLLLGILVVLNLTVPTLKILITLFPRNDCLNTLKTVFPSLQRSHLSIPEVDCRGYYAYLRSIALDKDVDFTNDLKLLGHSRKAITITKTGYAANPWTIGPAILWLPFFAVAHGISVYLPTEMQGFPANGVSPLYDFFIIIASSLYGCFGLIFIYLFLCCFFSHLLCFVILVCIFFGSALMFYFFHEPTMSHILSVFAVSGFLYFWYITLYNKKLLDWLLMGLWGGIAILVRVQDGVVILIPVLAELAVLFRANALKKSYWSGLLLFLTVTVLICIPQMIVWNVLYGDYITIPQGPGFMNWSTPKIIQVLFSTNHGLLTYTPIMLLAVAGLFLPDTGRHARLVSFVFITVFLVELYINAAVNDWYAGWAFGARRFLSCSLLFAWGLGNVLKRTLTKRLLLYTVAGYLVVLVFFNSAFYFQWIYGRIPRAGALTIQHYLFDKADALFFGSNMCKKALLTVLNCF